MPKAEPLQLHLEVERDATPITGRVALGTGESTQFAGWTELFAALEAVVARDRENAAPPTSSTCGRG